MCFVVLACFLWLKSLIAFDAAHRRRQVRVRGQRKLDGITAHAHSVLNDVLVSRWMESFCLMFSFRRRDATILCCASLHWRWRWQTNRRAKCGTKICVCVCVCSGPCVMLASEINTTLSHTHTAANLMRNIFVRKNNRFFFFYSIHEYFVDELRSTLNRQ